MSTTIPDNGFATQDLSEARVYTFDYDAENLAAGVALASAGTFVITPVTAPVLAQASQALVAGNRTVRVLLSGGVVGTTYTIEHTVSTTESPVQIKSKWFRLQIT